VRIIAYPFRDTQGFYPKKVKSRHAGFGRECCKYAFASLISCISTCTCSTIARLPACQYEDIDNDAHCSGGEGGMAETRDSFFHSS
jgi:hypothetical protein